MLLPSPATIRSTRNYHPFDVEGLANAGVAYVVLKDWSERGKGEDLLSLFQQFNRDFAAINEVAHTLGLTSVPLVRREETVERQRETVMAYADRLPLVWVGEDFSETVTAWARDRGPMTLLVQATDTLAEDERRRIERFVAILGRQAE